MGAVVPHGDLDIATVGDVEASVDRAARSGEDPLVLDLSRLDFMDSSGIHLLMRLRDRYGAGRLRVRGVEGCAARVMELSGVGGLFASPPGDA